MKVKDDRYSKFSNLSNWQEETAYGQPENVYKFKELWK